jgi:hypothetical protein
MKYYLHLITIFLSAASTSYGRDVIDQLFERVVGLAPTGDSAFRTYEDPHLEDVDAASHYRKNNH